MKNKITTRNMFCTCWAPLDVECVCLLQVNIVRDKVTFPGAKIKKKDEGMPHYDNNHEKGDLYVTFDIAFPKGELPTETKNGSTSTFLNLFYIYQEV